MSPRRAGTPSATVHYDPPSTEPQLTRDQNRQKKRHYRVCVDCMTCPTIRGRWQTHLAKSCPRRGSGSSWSCKKKKKAFVIWNHSLASSTLTQQIDVQTKKKKNFSGKLIQASWDQKAVLPHRPADSYIILIRCLRWGSILSILHFSKRCQGLCQNIKIKRISEKSHNGLQTAAV